MHKKRLGSIQEDEFQKSSKDQQTLIDEEVVLQSTLLGGANATTRIDSLYSAYWALLAELIRGLYKPESARNVLKSKSLTQFLRVTSTPSPEVHHEPPSASSAFRNLSPVVQNLLMAATELNIKLSNFEQTVSQNLSHYYEISAKDAAECALELAKYVLKMEESIKARSKNLHVAAVQQMMGPRFGSFTTKAFQSLHEWSKLSSKLGLQGLTSSHDMSTAEGILYALTDAKRGIAAATQILAKRNSYVPSSLENSEEDARFHLRMQKHQIGIQRASKVNELRESPEELAKALRILRIAEDEASASLESIPQSTTSYKSEYSPQRETQNPELDVLRQLINGLVDNAHILAVESGRIKEGIEAQVRNESKMELQGAYDQAQKCIEDTKLELKQVRSAAIQKYSEQVQVTRDAERTVASELQVYGKSSRENAASLEVCAKVIAETARVRKMSCDTKLLNEHKISLHKVVKAIVEKITEVSQRE